MKLFFMNPNVCGYPVDYDSANHALKYWMGDYDATGDGPLIAATNKAPASHTLIALAYGR